MIYNATIYNDSWNTKKLKELGDFSRGKSKHRPRNDPELFNNGTYPLVQTGDIKAATLHIAKHEQSYNEFGLSQSKLWPTGTLCITIAANIAETGILAYPMCFPDSIVGFTANHTETSELFMHYVFTYIRQSIQNSVSGSIQDNINIEYLKSLDFKIPEKPYQDKIVAVLSNLDEKIELNLKICSELESIAKTIYDYWFVQFDFPDENGNPYRTSGGEMVWNKQLKREIPKGWEIKRISDICEIISGYPFQSSTYSETGKYKLITIKNVQDSGIDINVDNYISNLPENLPDYCILSSGDILMSLTGNVGRVGLMYVDDCLLNQRVALIKPKHSYLNAFLYFLFKSDTLKKKMKNIATGTSQKNLSPVDTGNLLIPFNVETVKLFCDKLESIITEIVIAEKEKVEITKLRDWLLPMLMNGQARVE